MVRTFCNDGVGKYTSFNAKKERLNYLRKVPNHTSMYYILHYIQHLLTAKNQHSLHSPFVYNYVTKCLYGMEHRAFKETNNVLLKSIAYFELKTVALPKEEEELKIEIREQFPEIKWSASQYDLLFVNSNQQKQIQQMITESNTFHNDSVLIVNNIHRTKNKFNNWELLKKHDAVRVTIDLFYCGVVFFRTEQAKEHFKIRI